MINERLISFDLKADFGFFKKPDINDAYLTYNMLHKPALLGILGAIIGLKGFEQNKRLPDYYTLLKHVKIGIKPLETDNGNFLKCFIGYNNATGMASKEEGGILQVREQTLIHTERILYDYLKSYRAEFLPYMGKNDFSAWWDNFIEYTGFSRFNYDRNYRIDSIFRKSGVKASDLTINQCISISKIFLFLFMKNYSNMSMVILFIHRMSHLVKIRNSLMAIFMLWKRTKLSSCFN